MKNLGDEQNDNSEEQANSEGDEIYDDNERRRREQVKKMMEDKKQQLSEIERRRNEKRKRQRRNRIVLIGAICALAVAAAGIGVYYLVSNVNGGKQNRGNTCTVSGSCVNTECNRNTCGK